MEMKIYLEIEDVQYGRMLSELFDNITEGCLERCVYLKREEDEMARLIGRYTVPGDELTKEEGNILRENGFADIEIASGVMKKIEYLDLLVELLSQVINLLKVKLVF